MAKKSKCRQKHGSVIFKKNRIISKGFNKYKTHPKAKNHRFPSIHAEIDAILKANIDMLRGSSIMVVRINKEGNFMNSKPCNQCLDEINRLGIKHVIYSTPEGITEVIR